MSFYIPPSFVKNINSTFTNHSTRNKMVNGQLNNAVGMQKGKLLFTQNHHVAPSPHKTVDAVDQTSPAHSTDAKWANKNPGTGWSQKEMVENPQGHSKAVKEGVKNVPLMALTATAAGTGGMPTILGSAAAGGLAAGAGWIAEKVFGKNPFPWGKDK